MKKLSVRKQTILAIVAYSLVVMSDVIFLLTSSLILEFAALLLNIIGIYIQIEIMFSKSKENADERDKALMADAGYRTQLIMTIILMLIGFATALMRATVSGIQFIYLFSAIAFLSCLVREITFLAFEKEDEDLLKEN